MGKPTETELKEALRAAGIIRESGHDNHYLAKTIFNLHYRLHFYEIVLHAAENYLHSGGSEFEHARLVKAVEEARQVDLRTAGEEDVTFGLGLIHNEPLHKPDY